MAMPVMGATAVASASPFARSRTSTALASRVSGVSRPAPPLCRRARPRAPSSRRTTFSSARCVRQPPNIRAIERSVDELLTTDPRVRRSADSAPSAGVGSNRCAGSAFAAARDRARARASRRARVVVSEFAQTSTTNQRGESGYAERDIARIALGEPSRSMRFEHGPNLRAPQYVTRLACAQRPLPSPSRARSPSELSRRVPPPWKSPRSLTLTAGPSCFS